MRLIVARCEVRYSGRLQAVLPEAQEHGLTVGKVLPADLDESGGKLDRPGLNEALRRVESGESGGIIVAWLDRLSRDSEHAHGLVRRITEAGGDHLCARRARGLDDARGRTTGRVRVPARDLRPQASASGV